MLPPQVSPPQFALSDVTPTRVRGVELVALPVLAPEPGSPEGAAPVLGPGTAELVEEIDLDLFAALAADRADGTAGQITRIPVAGVSTLTNQALSTVLLVGVGDAGPAALRRAGAALGRATKDHGTLATSVPGVGDDDGLRAFVEGVVLGSFEFHLRSGGPRSRPVERVVVTGAEASTPALHEAIAVAGAGWRARALSTVPSNIKTPQWFCDQAVEIAAASGLEVEVYDEQRLAAEGFNGIVAVGQAAAAPPRLLRLEHTPAGAGRRTPHVVLVGKGITFDSGGLSIKPGQGMVTMKRDMTGGAVVLATMAALGEVGCPVRVTGLVPLAENAVSGNATRPGDVITHWGGRTTEVTNTDAEGRLVMADALAFAAAEIEPDLLLDVATLTGGMKVALGQRMAGAFATSDALFEVIRAAGEAAGEPFWRMPLADVYEEKLASKVADADNAPGHAPAITAALFLQHFTGGLPWAHLDIAPVGDAVEDAWEWTAGPTGFGARALLYWLGQAEPLAALA